MASGYAGLLSCGIMFNVHSVLNVVFLTLCGLIMFSGAVENKPLCSYSCHVALLNAYYK